MNKKDININITYFDRYIDLAEDEDFATVLKNSLNQLDQIDYPTLEKIGDQTYADGKWTIKQILQHIIDTERIFGERALRFARQDPNIPHGFDENQFAEVAKVNHRTFNSLVEELKAVRKSSLAMFESFDTESLQRTGKTPISELSVLSIAYIMIGHQIHHFNIIKERYYPLISQ